MLITMFVLVVTFGNMGLGASPAQTRMTIEGRVTNQSGRPLSQIRVMLKSSGYSEVGSALTDGSGRFRFLNLSSGTYYIEAEPGATDYERQTQRVDAVAFRERAGHSEVVNVDIVLPSRKTDSIIGPVNNADVILFHQDVPEGAKTAYDEGIKALEKGDFAAASQSLKRAIDLFPDYYSALERLGTEYVSRDDAKSAQPLLVHAVEINRDGWRGFYSLGIANYKLNRHDESVKALQRAVELNPQFANAHMWLGMVLATDPSMLSTAIQSLEQAVKLNKDPLPGQAYYYLGGLYAKNNQYKEAADAFETLLRVSPNIQERDKIKQLIQQWRQKAKEQGKK